MLVKWFIFRSVCVFAGEAGGRAGRCRGVVRVEAGRGRDTRGWPARHGRPDGPADEHHPRIHTPGAGRAPMGRGRHARAEPARTPAGVLGPRPRPTPVLDPGLNSTPRPTSAVGYQLQHEYWDHDQLQS